MPFSLSLITLTTGSDYVTLKSGQVIRFTVLPDFQFRISDLHRQPPLLALAIDPVYQHFVLPDYQTQMACAERLATKFRDLGVAADELNK